MSPSEPYTQEASPVQCDTPACPYHSGNSSMHGHDISSAMVFIDKQSDDCLQFFLIATPFYGNLIVVFELSGELVRS